MLHLLYILAFTVLAFLAVVNLIRNLMVLGNDSQRYSGNGNASSRSPFGSSGQVPHPELLDDSGDVVREPYLVMRSISVDDARDRLDALYKSSPSVVTDRDDDLDNQ
ncbi:MAG: DUF2973 domain-containing protein [Synechococcales bacterium]|nr:DUF2973 domain-containing protein [Synechococcales bacterium]